MSKCGYCERPQLLLIVGEPRPETPKGIGGPGQDGEPQLAGGLNSLVDVANDAGRCDLKSKM